MRLKNVLAFYQLYAAENSLTPTLKPVSNLLDVWIISRLSELNRSVSQALDAYKLDQAGKPIDEFIDDFSTWYLRRSRERLKSEDQKVQANAINTLREILLTLAKIIAPLMPFVAEEIYQTVKSKNDLASVHLEMWPEVDESYKPQAISYKLSENMVEVRRLVSLGLEARSKLGIKVRQPLQALFVQGGKPINLSDELVLLIKDEVNVKEVKWQTDLVAPVALDAKITPELKAEGQVRDFIRQVQDLRKEKKLVPKDKIAVSSVLSGSDLAVIEAHRAEIGRAVGAVEIRLSEGKITKISLERV